MLLRSALPLAILLAAQSASAQQPPPPAPSAAAPAGPPAPAEVPPAAPPPAGWPPPPPGSGWGPQPQQGLPPGWQPPPGWPLPGQPPAPPAAGDGRPTSVQQYAHARNKLKQQIKRAQREDRDADARRLKGDLEQMEDWQREDVQRRSGGAFAAGVVMISVGGLSLLSGFAFLITAEATDAANSPQDIQRGFQVASIATLLTGVGLLGGGIPLAVWGGEKVLIEDASSPAGVIVVSARGLRVEASF